MEIEQIPDEPELQIQEINRKYGKIEVPEEMPHFANIIPWFLIEGSWPKAAEKAGFDPEDKFLQRLASQHFEKYERYWRGEVGEGLKSGLRMIVYDPQILSEALGRTIMEYSRFLARPRRLRGNTPKALAFAQAQITADKDCMSMIKLIVDTQKTIKEMEEPKDITPTLEWAG